MSHLRLKTSLGGLCLALSMLVACGDSATATLAPVTTPASSSAASPTTARAASPVASGAASPTAATPTRAASPATPGASPTRPGTPGTPGTPGAGTPTAGLNPSQAYVRLSGQTSHRQRWNFTGFTIAGLSGNLAPTFDVAGNNRKVTLPDVAGLTLEAYQVGGVISVPNLVGGGYSTADPSNPLSQPAQALFGLPDTLIFTLAPVNATYTAQGTQTVNGRTATVYRAQVPLADLGFVSPTLQGQSGTANTTIYVDNAQGFLVGLESTIQSATATAGTAATARLDVTDVGQVPAITVPK